MPDYYAQWQSLQCSPADEAALDRFCRKVANAFLDRYFQDGTYESACIDLLCEMSTAINDAAMQHIPSSTLFEGIIEQFCDAFEERQEDVYNRVMAQVVDCYRRLETGRELDGRLRRFGIFSWEDLYCRACAVQGRNLRWDHDKPVDKIYLLSRVTIGADVAIVSVLIQRLARRFPDARIILIGPGKLREIFGGRTDLTIQALDYTRRGGVADRFMSWQGVLEIIDRENSSDPPTYILVDPDSRISQLGVLPLADMSNYLFFNSRASRYGVEHQAMAELANEWMDYTFGRDEFCWPKVWLPEDLMTSAGQFVRRLRGDNTRRITAVNFGVGGNSRKRLGTAFEGRLLRELLSDPQTTIILDKGLGPDEEAGCLELLAQIETDGHATRMTAFGRWQAADTPVRVWAVDGTIGQMSSLIGHSDDFIGYDSACQHIAAAQGIPTVTVFAGTNNVRFIRRWSACGQGPTGIVHVNTLSNARGLDHAEIVQRVLARRHEAAAGTSS